MLSVPSRAEEWLSPVCPPPPRPLPVSLLPSLLSSTVRPTSPGHDHDRKRLSFRWAVSSPAGEGGVRTLPPRCPTVYFPRSSNDFTGCFPIPRPCNKLLNISFGSEVDRVAEWRARAHFTPTPSSFASGRLQRAISGIRRRPSLPLFRDADGEYAVVCTLSCGLRTVSISQHQHIFV